MLAMLIHGKIGCETIVQDYISTSSLRNITIYIIRILSYGSIFITMFSLISILSNN